MTEIRASVGDLRSLGLVVWGCNSNTREAQPRRSEVHSKPGLYSKTQSQNHEMFLPLYRASEKDPSTKPIIAFISDFQLPEL